MPPAPPSLKRTSSAEPPPLLSFENVSKRYPDGGREITVLAGLCFDVQAGANVGLCGAPGSGKSTLLRLAAAIEPADGGSIRFDGQDITGFSAAQRARLLRSAVALLSQDDWLTSPGEIALDHVTMSIGACGLTLRDAKRCALQALEAVGVGAAGAAARTGSLSAEQRARVMLARALVREPRLLLVDEPAPMPSLTDHERFCATLRRVSAERGITLLVASQEIGTLGGMETLMSLSTGGELISTGGERGTVVELHPHRAGASGTA
jgi:peptide/nickel transport system ATP-binding protein